jgi:hypothetical protein
MKKIAKWIALFVVLILLSSCKKETLSYRTPSYLVNMTNDTFIIKPNNKHIDYLYHELPVSVEDDKPGSDTMLPRDRIFFDKKFFDSIFIYKYKDTNNVYIRFKCNEEPFNYRLNCYNNKDWIDTFYYKRIKYFDSSETYIIVKEYLFKIEKDKIINP